MQLIRIKSLDDWSVKRLTFNIILTLNMLHIKNFPKLNYSKNKKNTAIILRWSHAQY